MSEPDRLTVVVYDATTSEELGRLTIYDDYLLIRAGHPHLANTQVFGNGTHQLTIKDCGRKHG